VTFLLLQLVPGEPGMMVLNARGITPTDTAIAQINSELGYDQPLPVQYILWLQGVVSLDFGYSIQSNTPVFNELLIRMPATIELAVTSLFITVCAATVISLAAALNKDGFFDYFARILVNIGMSIPSFLLGILLIFFFSVKLKILPVMGRESLKSIILPASTLSLGMIAMYIRMLRTNILDVLSSDFISVARAKGLREYFVIKRHVLIYVLVTLVTLIGINLSSLLCGAVVVETIFSWPGIGKYVISAIKARDFPVVQGFILITTIIIVVINMLVDIILAAIDPRIRISIMEKD
jgi:ABC-type dipeptide/oligopeptide/nickel transport system permease component